MVELQSGRERYSERSGISKRILRYVSEVIYVNHGIMYVRLSISGM